MLAAAVAVGGRGGAPGGAPWRCWRWLHPVRRRSCRSCRGAAPVVPVLLPALVLLPVVADLVRSGGRRRAGGAPAQPPVVLSRNGKDYTVTGGTNVRAGTEIKVTTERPSVSLS